MLPSQTSSSLPAPTKSGSSQRPTPHFAEKETVLEGDQSKIQQHSPRSRVSKNGYSQFSCESPPSCKSPRSLDRTVTNHAEREGVLLSSHLRLSDSTLSPPAAQTEVWLSQVANGQLSCLPPAPPSPQDLGTCLVVPAPSHPQTKLSLALACSRAYSVSATTRPRHWPGPTQPSCHLPPPQHSLHASL